MILAPRRASPRNGSSSIPKTPVIIGSIPWISHTTTSALHSPSPSSARLTPLTEYYSTQALCRLSAAPVSSASSTQILSTPKKRCVVPCISSLSPPLAPCSGGLCRPSIRCQQLRAHAQMAHTRVVDGPDFPTEARTACDCGPARLCCLPSISRASGRHLRCTQPFLSTASMTLRVASSIWIDRPRWLDRHGVAQARALWPCSTSSQPR